ncbi:unnamed protein product [Heligmosomoides polygyrus]|uniref:Reverse transcriptase domain-containing protein n=1 Tax=Heligmosomoides polygyrus TaxID=6339 RepID=A0A183GGX9_HELPZ|nr:unnamed protein product [Heligmosomoides polygyrus]
MSLKGALKRWQDYFEGNSTKEFLHPAVPSADPILDPVYKVTVEETVEALRNMRPGKATGPEGLPADLWKSKFWYSAEWLAKFFNQIVAEKKVPDVFQEITTIPIWKKKDSPADCSNYRPILLLSHSMNISERILDRQIREIVKLSGNQCGFVAGCGTIDAMTQPHAARPGTRHLAVLWRPEIPPTTKAVVEEVRCACDRNARRRQRERVENHLTGTMVTRPGKKVNRAMVTELLYGDKH